MVAKKTIRSPSWPPCYQLMLHLIQARKKKQTSLTSNALCRIHKSTSTSHHGTLKFQVFGWNTHETMTWP